MEAIYGLMGWKGLNLNLSGGNREGGGVGGGGGRGCAVAKVGHQGEWSHTLIPQYDIRGS